MLRLAFQLIACVCAAILTLWIWMPWPVIAAVGLLLVMLVASQLTRFFRSGHQSEWSRRIGWISSACAWVGLFSTANVWDEMFAVQAWTISAAALLLPAECSNGGDRRHWRVLGLAWALAGSVIWLGSAYLQNRRGAFYAGLPIALTCVLLVKRWLRPPQIFIHAINTVLHLCVILPAADLILAALAHVDMRPESDVRYFSYEVAKKHPAAFQRWWEYYSEQGKIMAQHLFEPVTGHVMPFRLRPNSTCVLFQCPVSINRKGFRGREIPDEKGNTYRIVALGESTTFGYTIHTNDRPWPELLEQMIHDRITPARPVQVINAGTPAYSLKANLERLQENILALKPDMLISYHGYNGFPLLNRALPRVEGKPPPAYEPRPLKLLADCEYRLKMLAYRRTQSSKTFLRDPVFPPASQTEYAEAYRQLADTCRSNGIRLAVANFSMAVDNSSDLAVVEFYRSRFAAVHWQIKANMFHSKIVEALASEHPEICLVDIHPHMDGNHTNFIDLVHMTQEGRQQTAENIFAGIRKVLEEDLAASNAPAAPH